VQEGNPQKGKPVNINKEKRKDRPGPKEEQLTSQRDRMTIKRGNAGKKRKKPASSKEKTGMAANSQIGFGFRREGGYGGTKTRGLQKQMATRLTATQKNGP